MTTNTEYARRALAAWFRSGGPAEPTHAGRYEAEGRHYVQVWDEGGETLAVYRIDTAGRLKRLKRWPDPTAGAPEQTASGVNAEKNRRDLSATARQTIEAFRTGVRA